MKTRSIKFPALMLIFTAVIGISSCGEQSTTTTKTTDVTDTSKTELVSQVPATDSMLAMDHTANTAQEMNNEIKLKDPVMVNKTVTAQPAIKDVKATPVTTTATTTTPTAAPTTPAPVVVVTEPVKPTPPVKPVTVEVPKPVTVTAPVQVANDWPVPANYRSMKSPYAADNESIALGKTLYSTHCKSCHGTKGDGQGTKAASLDTEMRSFSSAGFKVQSIGEVFYKTTFGRKDMPKYEKKIADAEERWAVVNYIRSF